MVVRSPGAGGESRLEYPLGRKLYATSGSIRYPRFSRDGKRVAFLEDATGRGAGGRVATVDLEGHVTALSADWPSARGLAWSPRGDEIWFAAGESRTTRALRAVDLGRRQRLVVQSPASLTLWDVARDGRVLLSRDEERSALVGVLPGETAERDLSWFDASGLADLSEDGSMVLFDDRYGIYVRRTDGSPPVLLGLKGGFADDFSPDGRRVAATSAGGRQLVILPAGLGDPVPLPDHAGETPEWAHGLVACEVQPGAGPLRECWPPGVRRVTNLPDLLALARGTTVEDLPALLGRLAEAEAVVRMRISAAQPPSSTDDHPSPQDEAEQWITPEEAASVARVPVSRIYRWAVGKRWASRPTRRCLRIAKHAYSRWLSTKMS